MAIVANHVKMKDEDELDIQFWLSKTPLERIAEVTRMRINYYTWLKGSYPSTIEKVVTYRLL